MKRTMVFLVEAAIAALCLAACCGERTETLSGLDPQDFVAEKNGKPTALYTLKNAGGMEVCMTNYGGRLVSIMVPDKDGRMTDVILGFDNIEDYMTISNNFGASIGRYANRIGGAAFRIDGVTYNVDKNDGENCLHGGNDGWDCRVFDVEQPDSQTLVFSLASPDGDMGFPGNVSASITYRLTDDNAVDISYTGTTDAPTVVNLTNHAYFNLSGNHAEDAMGHVFHADADSFTPTDAALIPTGEILPVEGTPMDFRVPKTFAQDIEADFEALKLGRGYDHNWVLNTAGNLDEVAFSLYSPVSGIYMEGYTDQPGVQVYTGNFLTGDFAGKHGVVYPRRASVCLETQLFPDSPNKPEWKSPVLRPGETYSHRCIYRFSVK